MSEIHFFESRNKPQIGDIRHYFNERLQGRQAGISVIRDNLGNGVYSSTGFQEATMHDSHPATLVVSPQGRNIITRNRGLLHRIAQGEIDSEEIGQGAEGRVYRIELDTDDGKKPFALKYAFPVSKRIYPNSKFEYGQRYYTPGIDQMRMLQLLDRDNVLAGLHVVTPVLATLDMTLAPYIEHSIGGDTFLKLCAQDAETLSHVSLRQQDQDLLAEILETNSVTDPLYRFGHQFARALQEVTKGLVDWQKTYVQSGTFPFPLVTSPSELARDEPEAIHNIELSWDTLRNLFEKFKRREDIFATELDWTDPRVQEQVRNCCHLIEVTAGRHGEKTL